MSEAVACPKLCGRLRVHTSVCIALKYPHHGYMVSITYVVDIKSNRLEKGNEILASMGQKGKVIWKAILRPRYTVTAIKEHLVAKSVSEK